jgi:hypothetical protein
LFKANSDGTLTAIGSPRTGNGNITVHDLINGDTYAIIAQSYRGNIYSVATSPLYRTPRPASDTPVAKIGKLMLALKDSFLSSSSLLSWIQTFNANGNTSGRVILGRNPSDSPDMTVATSGPSVKIRVGGVRTLNAGSEGNFTHELELVAHISWYEPYLQYCQDIENCDWISKLLDEFEAVGNDLATGVGGQFLGITTGPDFSQFDEANRNLSNIELTFTIWY